MTDFVPNGVCASNIQFDIQDGVVRGVSFTNGCDGNAIGLARLVEGMPADEVIRRLKGVRCGRKPTSCPDQLALALEKRLKND